MTLKLSWHNLIKGAAGSAVLAGVGMPIVRPRPMPSASVT